MNAFTGDFTSMWSLATRPQIPHLTWDWWWWLVMLDDPNGQPSGQQLMVLWSTKDNQYVDVNGTAWKPKGRPGIDVHQGMLIDGMVCAWWFDGSTMIEPYIKQVCSMVVLPDTHPDWPSHRQHNEDTTGRGGGAVIPLTQHDLSMGLQTDLSSFWLTLRGDSQAIEQGAPCEMKLNIAPWNEAMSCARPSTATYAGDMGYDILRVHGSRVIGTIDSREVQGTAYFQKVCVQAPSPPWYWGVLHFEDGSYLDWFLPHISLTMTSTDDRAWKKRDAFHYPLSQGGIFHDAGHLRTERFERVTVTKVAGDLIEPNHGTTPQAPLPEFEITLKNGRTTIRLIARAVARANWDFHQPTRGGLWSHLTYNEYPLFVPFIEIQDEFGIRKRGDFGWIRGNAEHAWGILH